MDTIDSSVESPLHPHEDEGMKTFFMLLLEGMETSFMDGMQQKK